MGAGALAISPAAPGCSAAERPESSPSAAVACPHGVSFALVRRKKCQTLRMSEREAPRVTGNEAAGHLPKIRTGVGDAIRGSEHRGWRLGRDEHRHGYVAHTWHRSPMHRGALMPSQAAAVHQREGTVSGEALRELRMRRAAGLDALMARPTVPLEASIENTSVTAASTMIATIVRSLSQRGELGHRRSRLPDSAAARAARRTRALGLVC